jgi:hypothetical protein
MKLHIHFDFEKTRIDEVIDGKDAESVVAEVKERVAKRAGFLIAVVVRGMTPLAFAQEATRRYAAMTKETIAIPTNCDEFIAMALQRNFATLLSD